LYYQL